MYFRAACNVTRGKLTNFSELLRKVWQFDWGGGQHAWKIHEFSLALVPTLVRGLTFTDSPIAISWNRIPEIISPNLKKQERKPAFVSFGILRNTFYIILRASLTTLRCI